MSSVVATIGYEGSTIDLFIASLVAAGIRHVIDVRDVPSSRKKGFSKSSLANSLAEVRIKYTHLKALGDPKPGRDAMRRGDFRTFISVYSAHVASPSAQQSLAEAAAIACAEPAALLCYERDPRHCHRTLVAERLTQMAALSIKHLGANAITGAGARLSHERQGAVALV